jgi:endogenous inhibitor of DNA gyrase (YacG/DUF329 family)
VTEYQKTRIMDMRVKGYRYSRISDILGVPINTVKSFCLRVGIVQDTKIQQGACPHCGKPLISVSGTKPKRFCDERCRYAWWNAHREELNRKSAAHIVCAHCGITFAAYSGTNRKYCSHHCYITARYPTRWMARLTLFLPNQLAGSPETPSTA